MSKKSDQEQLLAELEKANFALKQIVACLEKRLSGQVILNFNSAEAVKNKGGVK